MNATSAELLQHAINNLGDSFGRSRAMDAENAYRTAQLDEQRKRTQLDDDYRKWQMQKESAGDRPMYRWKSGGVEHTARSGEDFSSQITQFPADKDEKGNTKLHLTGTDEHGVTATTTLDAPSDLADNDAAKQKIGGMLNWFNQTFQPVAKGGPVDSMPSEFNRDPNKEYITKGGALIPKAHASPSELETVTEEFPATPGTPATPSRTEGSLWWKKDIPGTPGTPATPAKKVTRKVPVGTSPSNQVSGAAIKAALANELSKQNPDWTREQIISEVNKRFSK